MIDGKLNTEVSRGQQAKALLENKIFTEAFKETMTSIWTLGGTLHQVKPRIEKISG